MIGTPSLAADLTLGPSMQTRSPSRERQARPTESLTATEVRTLELLGSGLVYKEAAHADGVSVAATRARVGTIRRRPGARNLAHALVLAMARGLMAGPGNKDVNCPAPTPSRPFPPSG